jgi:hypothetical protein
MIMTNNKIIKYKFAEQYTKYPGGRFERLGTYSGEDFREKVLRKIFESPDASIEIDATNVITSFSPSFLDECFGHLAHEYGMEVFKEKVKLFSNDNPELTEKMMYYVKRAVYAK